MIRLFLWMMIVLTTVSFGSVVLANMTNDDAAIGTTAMVAAQIGAQELVAAQPASDIVMSAREVPVTYNEAALTTAFEESKIVCRRPLRRCPLTKPTCCRHTLRC